MTQFVKIPRIEDEIERAWRAYAEEVGNDARCDRSVFEAGFRAARTFTQTGATAMVGGAT